MFQVNIETLPELKLCGVNVRTDMQNAYKDCSDLWEKTFVPLMPSLSGKPLNEFQGDSYGVSVVVDMESGTFDYWAAMPCAKEKNPEGMQSITLPAGLYATCRVESLEQLSAAFSYLYSDWFSSQQEFRPVEAPCFELYSEEYMRTGALSVYIPIQKV